MSLLLLFTIVTVFILFLALKLKQPHSPKFTTVKKYELNQIPFKYRELYNSLTAKGYYVTCYLQIESISIPLALEPFRMVFIEEKSSFFYHALIKMRLSMKGWKVVPFSNEMTRDEISRFIKNLEDDYLLTITNTTKLN